MATMCRDAHIDPELFGLFIHDEIYLQYANRLLQPQQVDAADPGDLFSEAGLSG